MAKITDVSNEISAFFFRLQVTEKCLSSYTTGKPEGKTPFRRPRRRCENKSGNVSYSISTQYCAQKTLERIRIALEMSRLIRAITLAVLFWT
jgi:hypothetical protein